MERLFYLISDLNIIKKIKYELNEVGIKESSIHVIGPKSGEIKHAHLHEATLIQKTDLVPALKRGALLGILFSAVLAGFYFYAIPKFSEINLFILVGILIFGIAFGLWCSSLIGVSIEDPIVEKFKKYIKQGYYIMMVDATDEEEKKHINHVMNNHPEAKLVGTE